MNKKFIKISLIICIPIVLLIYFFAITVKSINDEPFEEPEKEIAIEYNGYKENKNRYTISILVKNNSKDIKDIVEDASKKADDYNNKLEKKEGKVNEKEL